MPFHGAVGNELNQRRSRLGASCNKRSFLTSNGIAPVLVVGQRIGFDSGNHSLFLWPHRFIRFCRQPLRMESAVRADEVFRCDAPSRSSVAPNE